MGRLTRRFWNWLPSSIDRRVRVVAWLSLAFQVVLIGTGGAVRLTASGLGCPTWPRCTADSFVNTPEMGLHGIIEFGNRMLTFVLAIIVIAAFLSVLRYRRGRRDLFVLTLLQGLSIPFQAVLGGITVLTGLNPYVVGAHFAVSIVLVAVTTTLVWRVYRGPRGSLMPAPRAYATLVHVTSLLVAVTVVVGILTTGSGPHAGDNSNPLKPAPRNGLDPELLQHVHSWPAYATFALTLAVVIAAFALRLPRRWPLALLAVEVVQIIVGITQARLGLPEVLVGIHMILAGLLVAAITATVLSLRAPSAVDAAPAERRYGPESVSL
ncbi:COX15/CtaA family protein [Naasia lichenicola]|uniref:COX15/CtaA family protein n=1 Tax=Naasia lichenicola TaxID=2565933 RepID=UPI001E4B2FD4|nr:COX15/CtaA family protein [Naasia lichenicola]